MLIAYYTAGLCGISNASPTGNGMETSARRNGVFVSFQCMMMKIRFTSPNHDLSLIHI